jgi:ABC-type Mn2+/Zn2+ transport system permease subunit
VLALGVLVAAIALALVAQFALSSWAETSQLNHDLQHGIIFVSGVGAGAALVVLHRRGRRSVSD